MRYPTGMRALLRRIHTALQLDSAISFSVIALTGRSVTSALSLVLLSYFISKVVQGYYYSFMNILALRTLLDIGVNIATLQVSSHAASRISWNGKGPITAQPESLQVLAAIFSFSKRWYTWAAVLFSVAGLLAGALLFGSRNDLSASDWAVPWILTVISTAVTFRFVPHLTLIEAFGLVPECAKYRAIEMFASNAALCIGLVALRNLYAPALSSVTSLFVMSLWLRPYYRNLFSALKSVDPIPGAFDWRRDLRPLQSRVAVSHFAGYVSSALITPAIFSLRGPVLAGQWGMTMQLVAAASAIPLVWVTTKAVPFGRLIALGKHDALELIFKSTVQRVFALTVMTVTGVLFLMWCAGHFRLAVAGRVLPGWTLVFLLITSFFTVVTYCEAVYVRAHKEDPLALPASFGAGLTVISLYALSLANGWGVFICMYVGIGLVVVTWSTRRFVAARSRYLGQSEALVSCASLESD